MDRIDAMRVFVAALDAGSLAAAARRLGRSPATVTRAVAFLEGHVGVRLLLLDRTVNLIDEGVDLGLRIAHLPDSSLIGLRVGTVRRVVCASPEYLARKPPIIQPADLAAHDGIALTQFRLGDLWSFSPEAGGTQPRSVHVASKLSVNAVEAAISSAVEGHGITRVLSYQVETELRDGRLVLLLEDAEPPPLPVHMIVPEGRLMAAKVRAFVDFALPRLKIAFATLAEDRKQRD